MDGQTDQLHEMQCMYASGNHVPQLHTLHKLHAMLVGPKLAFQAQLQYCSYAQPAS